MIYTIIDVETTGKTNRITEISIFKYDGTRIVDEFTSLINPETPIPDYITALTGIDDEMVANAPLFSEVATEILSITEDTTFVAHNVNFDYNVINGEFTRLKIPFRRKKLCTIRLSRKLLPGLASYSLGKLCSAVDIQLTDRHRAKGDAEATVKLFELLLQQENASDVFETFLKANNRQATLPAHLPDEVFENIPNSTGVYFFKDQKNKIIYVGKAKDLKKRVLSHFYDKKQKELDLCRETAHIDFELSGSEFLALLMEDAAIKKHLPPYNVSAKKVPKNFGIFNYTDRRGVLHFSVNTLKLCPNPLIIFHTKQDALLYLEKICKTFGLCPKYCNLQHNVTQCDHYKINSCKGICTKKESPALYNIRVKQAKDYIVESTKNKIIKLPGRNFHEEAFVLIKDSIYMGYGFINRDLQITSPEQLESYLTPQKDSLDIQRILRKHASKH